MSGKRPAVHGKSRDGVTANVGRSLCRQQVSWVNHDGTTYEVSAHRCHCWLQQWSVGRILAGRPADNFSIWLIDTRWRMEPCKGCLPFGVKSDPQGSSG